MQLLFHGKIYSMVSIELSQLRLSGLIYLRKDISSINLIWCNIRLKV